MNVVGRIRKYHRDREPERLALKYARLAEDPLSFFRGTPNLFYEDWPAGPLAQVETPLVWLCGDLHLENFGTYRGDNRSTYFDFNDFDEACLGPASWDLTRLLTSIAIEGMERQWRTAQIREVCDGVLTSYAAALAAGKARWVERETAEGIVQDLFQKIALRRGDALLDRRTDLHRRRRLIRQDTGKALPLDSTREAKKLAALIESLGRFRYLDGARRIAGNSSLGVPRFVLLVEDHAEELFLLDLKQARPPVALLFNPGPPQPQWQSEAHRVVSVQFMVQAIPPAFLRSIEYAGSSWILRELMPSEDRVEIAKASNRKFAAHADSLGQVVAWGHLRSGGRYGSATIDALVHFGERRSWRGEVARYAVDYAEQVRKDWSAYRKSLQTNVKK